MSKKRVLFLIPNLAHGGAEKVLVNLVNNMDREKFDITLQTLFDVGVNKQYLKSDVHYKSFLKRSFRGNSHIIKLMPPKLLYKLIVHDQYDIVVSYLEGPTTRIISGCPYKESKKVCWVHIELDDDKKYRIGFMSHNSATESYLKFDNIVCVSDTVKIVFEQSAGVKFPHIEVLYNTNETAQIRQKALEPIDDVQFDPDTVNVCSVAKIISTKGYDRLVRVHKRLMDEGLKHHIYILGIGEQQKELEEYLADEGLLESFTFLGFRDNPYKYVAACDMYVCSSRREGFSTAVTEALVVGTPVVSTCCSGAYELLGEHGEFGIVTENSEDGIYEGMKKMISDAKLRERYAELAKERGLKFSTENTVEAVEDMLLGH